LKVDIGPFCERSLFWTGGGFQFGADGAGDRFCFYNM
jgi:hypothetical protein